MNKLTVTLQDSEADRYKRLFEAACDALGQVGDALGCDPNEGGPEPLLDAIEELKAKLTEANLQYISDFGLLQAQEPVAEVDEDDSGLFADLDTPKGVMVKRGQKLYAAAGARPGFDLITHLHRQIAFSQRTFGPGERTAGVLDHIRKELIEIEAAPADLTEWIDLILLALDGAWRAGHTAEAICQGIDAKQTKNEGRTWPDWRTAAPGKAIEHVRSADTAPALADMVDNLKDATKPERK